MGFEPARYACSECGEERAFDLLDIAENVWGWVPCTSHPEAKPHLLCTCGAWSTECALAGCSDEVAAHDELQAGADAIRVGLCALHGNMRLVDPICDKHLMLRNDDGSWDDVYAEIGA